MHHKLISSRLLGAQNGLFAVGQGPPSRGMSEASPTINAKNGIKQASTATETLSKSAPRKHVPLDSGLAKIISLEIASDEEFKNGTVPEKTTSGTAKAEEVPSREPKLQPLQCPSLLERNTAPLPAGIPAAPTVSYKHQAPAAAPSALMAARLAEEQELLKLYLQHRQRQSNLQEQIQLEQLCRMQTAMLFYQNPQAATLPYLESLLAGRNAANMAPEMYSRQQAQAVPQTLRSAPKKPAASPRTPTSGSSGANPSLLSSAPKRPLDGTDHISIKERPEEYQHLSKKAKRTPVELAASMNELGQKVADDHSETSDDEERKAHRFRPYQFEQWTEKFSELRKFRKEKNHCQVPHTYQDNPALARWVKRQRYQYKLKADGQMSTMTDERITLLENIGFIWDSHAAAWAEKLYELKDFHRERGHCNVPSTYPENPQLATWVKCQRRQYKLLRDGKTSNMTMDRIVELENVGFVWEVRKSWDQGPLPTRMDRIKALAIQAAKERKGEPKKYMMLEPR